MEFSQEVVFLFVHIRSASWEISLAAGFKCNSKSNTPKSLSDVMLVAGTFFACPIKSKDGEATFHLEADLVLAVLIK